MNKRDPVLSSRRKFDSCVLHLPKRQLEFLLATVASWRMAGRAPRPAEMSAVGIKNYDHADDALFLKGLLDDRGRPTELALDQLPEERAEAAE